MKSIPRNVKIILTGLAPLVGLILLSVFAFKFGLGKISEVREKVVKARNDVNILGTKLNILQEAQGVVAENSSMATSALPFENPVLTVLTQVKSVSVQNGVILENVKAGGEIKDSSGLFVSVITFDVNGPRPQIFEFLGSISKIAPISVIDKVKFSESAGSGRATVSVKTFWAELPTKIPAVDQAISDLTPDERKVLAEISQLVIPTFSEAVPGAGAGKTDPFAF